MWQWKRIFEPFTTCNRVLTCGIHRCPEIFHPGPCPDPCSFIDTKSCKCGLTRKEVPCHQEVECGWKCQRVNDPIPNPIGPSALQVPCGSAANLQTRRCIKLCEKTPSCRHGLKPHECHYGPCPECKLLCDEVYPCGHKCKQRCHGPTPGSPCPPCPELVSRLCVGNHLAAQKMINCSDRTQFTCDDLCGKILPCGKHCCPKKCHPGECAACKTLIRKNCPCEAEVLECFRYSKLSEKTKIELISCSGPCHRELPNCTHLCPKPCHYGDCPLPEKCGKKVVVRCKCSNLSKEWICKDVQAVHRDMGSDPKDVPKNRVGLIPCDSTCKSKLVLQQGVQASVESVPSGENAKKQRKKAKRVQDIKEVTRLEKLAGPTKKILMVVMLMATLAAVSYYGYKGLLWISEWMNEMEEQRQGFRRYPR